MMPHKSHKIELELTPSGFGSKVLIDGFSIPHVSKVTVVSAVGKDATRVYLEIVAMDGVSIKAALVETKEVEPNPEGHGIPESRHRVYRASDLAAPQSSGSRLVTALRLFAKGNR